MLPPIEGIPTWTLFSSPTIPFQKLYDFYTDTFSILDIGPSLSASTMTLYTHDVRKKDDNFKEQTFHLYSGEALKRGVFAPREWLDVAIGSILDLSEAQNIEGERMRAGLDLRLRKLNQEGGLDGKLLRVYFENDRYTPSLTLEKAHKLVEKWGIKVIITTVGTSTSLSLLPEIKSEKILELFPLTGTSLLRQRDLKYTIHYRTSYTTEAKALVKYAKENLYKQQFGFFYQDDPSGREAV